MAKLQELVDKLQKLGCFDRSAFQESDFVVSYTGFIHDDRANIRELCSLIGLRFCGDLVKDWTTHLIVNSITNGPTAKITKAWEWGIDVVSLQWLMDSIDSGHPISCDDYLIPCPTQAENHQPPATGGADATTKQPQKQQAKRPSSVASNIPRKDTASNSPSIAQAGTTPRNPLTAVNIMMRQMSISPAPAAAAAITHPTHSTSPDAMIVGGSHSPMEANLNSPELSLRDGCAAAAITPSNGKELEAGNKNNTVNGNGAASFLMDFMSEGDQPSQDSSASPDGMSLGAGSADSPMQFSPMPQPQPTRRHKPSRFSPEELPLPSQPRDELSPMNKYPSGTPSDGLGSWGGAAPGLTGSQPTPTDDASPSPLEESQPLAPPLDDFPCETPLSGGGMRADSDETPLALTEPQLPSMVIPLTQYPGPAPSPDYFDDGCKDINDADGPKGPDAPDTEPDQDFHAASPIPDLDDGESVDEDELNEAVHAVLDRDRHPAPIPAPAEVLAGPNNIKPVQQQWQGSQGISSIRGWSDDDCSDGDEHQRGTTNTRRALPTGLTQIPNPVIARPTKVRGLPQDRGGAREEEDGAVVVGKMLLRPPRGTTVKEYHVLANLKAVKYTEQVCLNEKGITLSTKDKKTAIQVPHLDLPGSSSEGSDAPSSSKSTAALGNLLSKREPDVWLAEVQALYKLPNGSWNVEYCRFYTGSQAERGALASGKTFALPYGFNRTNELLKSSVREHCALSKIAGTATVRKVKNGGPVLQLRGAAGRTHFWRSGIDPQTWVLLTDRPVTDFLLSQ